MIPPPSPSDGSALPPRHRPSMGNLGKDTTEVDLWAFDDLDAAVEEIPLPGAEPVGCEIPQVRQTRKPKAPEDGTEPVAKMAGGPRGMMVDVGKSRGKVAVGISSGHSKPGDEFDDLDHLDLPAPAATMPEVAPPPMVEPVAEVTPAAVSSAPVYSGVKLHLSKLERIGLLTLLAALVVGGIAVFLGTISRLPSGVDRFKAIDFPIVGKHVSIASATNFWRAPKSTETVRRGTQLVPVLELSASGKPAAIRVLFRNSEGEVVGDAVTRHIQPGAPLQVTATAGFDDVGMHAAYRTGREKPWTIEVLEAPSENSVGADYKKLFEMDVSPERR